MTMATFPDPPPHTALAATLAGQTQTPVPAQATTPAPAKPVKKAPVQPQAAPSGGAPVQAAPATPPVHPPQPAPAQAPPQPAPATVQRPGGFDTGLSFVQQLGLPIVSPLAGMWEGNRLQGNVNDANNQWRKSGKADTPNTNADLRDFTAGLSPTQREDLKRADPGAYSEAQVSSMSDAMAKGQYASVAKHASQLGMSPASTLNAIYQQKGDLAFQKISANLPKYSTNGAMSREQYLQAATKEADKMKMSPQTRNMFFKRLSQAAQSIPTQKDIFNHQQKLDTFASSQYGLQTNQLALQAAQNEFNGGKQDDSAFNDLTQKVPLDARAGLIKSYYQYKKDERNYLESKKRADDAANAKAAALAVRKQGVAQKGKANAYQAENMDIKKSDQVGKDIEQYTNTPAYKDPTRYISNIMTSLDMVNRMLKDPTGKNTQALQSAFAGTFIRSIDQQAARQFLTTKLSSSQSWQDQVEGQIRKARQGGIGFTPETLRQYKETLTRQLGRQTLNINKSFDDFKKEVDDSGLSKFEKERLYTKIKAVREVAHDELSKTMKGGAPSSLPEGVPPGTPLSTFNGQKGYLVGNQWHPAQ